MSQEHAIAWLNFSFVGPFFGPRTLWHGGLCSQTRCNEPRGWRPARLANNWHNGLVPWRQLEPAVELPFVCSLNLGTGPPVCYQSLWNRVKWNCMMIQQHIFLFIQYQYMYMYMMKNRSLCLFFPKICYMNGCIVYICCWKPESCYCCLLLVPEDTSRYLPQDV